MFVPGLFAGSVLVDNGGIRLFIILYSWHNLCFSRQDVNGSRQVSSYNLCVHVLHKLVAP